MTSKIPLKLKDQIERIILKILYEEKSVRTLKLLAEGVLERTLIERITISEKIIISTTWIKVDVRLIKKITLYHHYIKILGAGVRL